MGLLDDILTGRLGERKRMERELAKAAVSGRVENFTEKGIQLRVPKVSAGRLGAATAMQRTTGMVDPGIFDRVEDIVAFPDDDGATYKALADAGIREGSSLDELSRVLGGLTQDRSNPSGGTRAAGENGAGRSRANMAEGYLEGYLPSDNTLSNFMQLQSAIDENMRLMNIMLNGFEE